MKSKLMIIAVLLFSSKIHSQKDSIVNPNKQWFFGAEFGGNDIISFAYDEDIKSLQGGLLAEYFFSEKWSITARLKYFKIGYSTGLSTINDVVDRSNYHRFDAKVIALPINLKWEYKIVKKFRGNLKFGIALNQEVERQYQYPIGAKTNYPAFFMDYNIGFGFYNYITNNSVIYIEHEFKGYGPNQVEGGNLFIFTSSANNSFFNVGIKHNFKSKTK
mgnify:CR=1 FL=1